MENVTENFIPMGSAIVNEQNPALYVLGFPPFLNGTYLKLYRISLEKPGYSVVSDTIHFYFDEVRSKALLFYFRKTQEFYAIIKAPMSRDSTSYKIFSLSYPPVSRSMMSTTLKSVLSKPTTWMTFIYWMVGILSLIMIYVLVLLLKKLVSAERSMEAEQNLNSLVSNKTPKRSGNSDKKLVELPRKNAIYILGDFRIYDADGADISHQFSTKLRQLFLSVLLLSNEEKGITNEKLNSIHWTYHSPESAKNNRNVNLKKLRDLTTNLKGVQIVHSEGSWMLKLTSDVFCDYFFLLKKMKEDFTPITREEFEKLILTLAHGIFVSDERMPWLDTFNSHFLTLLLDYLFLLLDSFGKDKNPEAIHRVAEIILKCDPMNEDAFKLKIEALVRLKNHNQAFLDYEYFTKGYEKMYGIQFPLSFKSFI
jgi:two-component SAPR family response regulator